MATKKGGKKAAKKGGTKKAAKKGGAKKAAKKRQFEPAGVQQPFTGAHTNPKVYETFQKERRILQAKFVVPLVLFSIIALVWKISPGMHC